MVDNYKEQLLNLFKNQNKKYLSKEIINSLVEEILKIFSYQEIETKEDTSDKTKDIKVGQITTEKGNKIAAVLPPETKKRQKNTYVVAHPQAPNLGGKQQDDVGAFIINKNK